MKLLRTVCLPMTGCVVGFGIFASITAFSAQAGTPLPVVLPFVEQARLVQRSEHGVDRVEVIAGSLGYVDSDRQEGYKAEQSIPLTGRQASYVYDFRPGLSAYQLSDEIENRLRQSGYKIVFRCQRSGCGELEGWKVFLGNQVSGSEMSQYYILARKQRADTSISFVQIYTNDIGKMPRLIVNVYDGEVAIDAARINGGENLLEIPFALNSAELSVGGREALRSFMVFLSKAGVAEIKSIEISGYTDIQGTPEHNEQLSRLRADVIARWLHGEEILQGVAIVTHAGGVAADGRSNTKVAASLGRYRKAEIRVVRGSDMDVSDKVAAK